jgi:tetratricopeptide (TPR) repeat protein
MWPIVVALLFMQASDPVSEGSKALDEGRFEAAIQSLTQAIAADPKDYYSHFNLALAYASLHRDEESIAEYRKTLELKPKLYEAELNAGMMLVQARRPEEALPLLEDAAAQKPKEFRPQYYLAEAQLATGSPAAAEESFRAALQADPASADAKFGMGRALAGQQKLGEAAAFYREAAAAEPSFRDALLELAGLYETAGQPAEAIAIYREFPANAAAQRRLGELLLRSRQYGDAVSRLERAYAASPTNDARIALADAYLANGQADRALPLLQQASAASQQDFEVRMAYARGLRDRREFAAAAEQFYQAAKLRPKEVGPWTELGSVLYLAGNLPESLGAFDHARDLGENSAGLWFSRAIILDKLRQLQPALDAYERFLSMDQGKNSNQEFQARARARILRKQLEKR